MEDGRYRIYEHTTYINEPWSDQHAAYNVLTIICAAIGNPLANRDGMPSSWQNGRRLASTIKNSVTICKFCKPTSIHTQTRNNPHAGRHSSTTRNIAPINSTKAKLVGLGFVLLHESIHQNMENMTIVI